MTKATWGIAFGFAAGVIALAGGAMAAGPYDGAYSGMQTQTQTNNSGFCQNLTHGTRLMVTNNVITYSWGRVPLETTVNADGSFSVDAVGMQTRGASGGYSLKGRITGVSLEADVGGSACAAHLSLKRG
jgi:hypothetical protein